MAGRGEQRLTDGARLRAKDLPQNFLFLFLKCSLACSGPLGIEVKLKAMSLLFISLFVLLSGQRSCCGP